MLAILICLLSLETNQISETTDVETSKVSEPSQAQEKVDIALNAIAATL